MITKTYKIDHNKIQHTHNKLNDIINRKGLVYTLKSKINVIYLGGLLPLSPP